MTQREMAIVEAVKSAKRSQFKATAIKVELEAQMSRSYGDFESTTQCHDWIMERLSELGLAEYDEDEYNQLSHGVETAWHPIGALKYAEFYFDGSVDSEFTFTLSLKNEEDILLLPKFIKVFKDLAKANGNGMDVRGAGMHMAWVNNKNCYYPVDSTSAHLERYENFKRSLTLLLPALYFLGTSSDQSRGLTFRRPEVGRGTHRAAIDYRGGALEFRVFDTCYATPSAILDNVVVMSKALRYWTKVYKPSGMEKVTTRIKFGVDTGDTLDRFYVTHKHIDLLNAGLARLKPSYYTIREVKKQRKFVVTKSVLDKRKEEMRKAAETEYAEYDERFNWQLIINRGRYMQRLAEDRIYQMQNSFGAAPVIDSPEVDLERQVDALIETEKSRKKSTKQYIADKLRSYEAENSGNYTLTA